MKPIFTGPIREKTLKALGVYLTASFVFLFLARVAFADTTNFTGEFQAAFWTAQPQAGSIGFSNSNTELVIAGPNKPSSETTSIEPIVYNGPTTSGLVTDGTVKFDWDYESPFGLDDAAYFAYTPLGGTTTQLLLAQGAGDFGNTFSINLSQGSTFEFVLFTDTPANKTGGMLIVSNFTFQSSVPEPSTAAVMVLGVTVVAIRRRRHS